MSDHTPQTADRPTERKVADAQRAALELARTDDGRRSDALREIAAAIEANARRSWRRTNATSRPQRSSTPTASTAGRSSTD